MFTDNIEQSKLNMQPMVSKGVEIYLHVALSSLDPWVYPLTFSLTLYSRPFQTKLKLSKDYQNPRFSYFTPKKQTEKWW